MARTASFSDSPDCAAQTIKALTAALKRLSRDERAALELRYHEGLAYKDMAARTGRAISTLQARVEAALRKIRDHIGTGPDPA